ncbi:hypothetical protein [Natronobiforma cellulositropha]|uniref:hypothetical protein n=1 Tax=Natronobiforma cellulositropha TaxID=1679076 RepID=UPI0021D60839|nr:hypothetical protein [Natronobiforma cellulositropha]
MGRLRRPHASLAAVTLAFLVVLARSLRRRLESRRVDDVPFCPVVGRWRIGADWALRAGVAGDPVPGELESFASYDRPGFDTDLIDSEVRRFYERTTAYALAYETRWHRGFRAGAWLATTLTRRLEQLALPGRSGRVGWLESDLAAVTPAVDPRGSRVWTRTDPATGRAVFVALYTTHEREGVTYANVAVPLPWSNLSTVLRPEALGSRGNTADAGVRFTTRGGGDGGLYLVTPLGAFRLPMHQRFRVWPVDAPGAPRAPVPEATLVATHEMWLFGRQFLTITYGIVPAET